MEEKKFCKRCCKEFITHRKRTVKCLDCRYIIDPADPKDRLAYNRAYYTKNRSRINKRKREWSHKKRRTDALYKIEANLRSRTSAAFKRLSLNKPAKTKILLGASYQIIKEHIEKQFKDNMTWGNYGEWHIDHKMPLALAKDTQELVVFCHYSNLQPLWSTENISKGSKIIK